MSASVRSSRSGDSPASTVDHASSFQASFQDGDARFNTTGSGQVSAGHFGNEYDAEESPRRTSLSRNPCLSQLSFSIGGPVQIPLRDIEAHPDEDGVGPSFAHRDAVVDMNGSNRKDPPEPITVKFEDVDYTVEITPPQPFFWDIKGCFKSIARKSTHKQILHSITGSVVPGEVLAMMGPSGSGKTTLLNVLGGRVKKGLTGRVLYNDMPYNKALKRRMGFVTQDDVLFAHLTVRETLMYAALLRLPKSMTRSEKIARTDQTIVELGLERCKNTIIGGPFLRGISGGERKRVSIGHEILIDPSLMLLDEPTSGLDSTTALKIIQILHQLAEGGRTIITTVHQPSSRIFKMFNKLIVLAEGRTIFFGQAKDAMSYFESVGFMPMFATNPADFLLDLATGTTSGIQFPDAVAVGKGESSPLVGTALQTSVREYLTTTYQTRQLPHNKDNIHALPLADETQRDKMKDKRSWSATWFEQFAVLFVRGIKERRHELLSWLRIIQVLAISIIVGCLWLNSKNNTALNLQDQVGMLFFISIFWGFFPLFTAIFTFPQERAMLAKERASNMYRLSSYFFSRTLSDMPMELILPTVFLIITYWMADLKGNFGIFLLTLLAVYLDVVVAQGIGLFLGAVVMDVKKATTLASVILLTFMLAGGYYLQKIPAFISWVRYISFNWFAYRLIIKIQYSPSQTYDCGSASPTGDGRCSIQQAPALRNVPLSSPIAEVWPLLIMVVGYRLLAYISLRRMKTGGGA